jgi:putative two-component system response regulator
MNFKPWWLTVIFISSIQLMLLLIAVVWLFAWLSGVTEEQLGHQTCLDNQTIGRHLAETIEAATIRRVRSESDSDRDELDSVIRQIELPNNGFVWVLDGSSGEILSQNPIQKVAGQTPGKLILYSVADDKKIDPLIDTISFAKDQRTANGKLAFGGKEHFVNARILPQLNSILVIGQQRSLASNGLAGVLFYAKNLVFGGTLLLGLICICLIVAILRRINDSFNNLNNGLEKKVSDSARELVRTKNAVIFGLAKLAESRDNDTGEHLDRIRTYVTILAKEVALHNSQIDEEFIHHLALASSLHDIGKVGIPDSILLKPGRLTPEERGIMELHTLIGGECLDAIHSRLGENAFMHIARQVAYYHHERWDGTGYPHSLKEDEIPLVARIVAVADVYDALTSKRPYKKAMSHLESKAIILSGSGKHFDPEIVDAFLRHEDTFDDISRHQQFVSDEDATSSFQRLCEAVKS